MMLVAGIALTTILLSPHRLNGQTINGTIVGTVSDPSQAAAPGAKVTVTNVQTNEQREVTTSPTGDYVLSALPLGTYRVKVGLSGFKTSIRENILVSSGQPIRVDFRLAVGQTNQTVTVSGQSPVLQTESSGVQSVVGTEQLTQLPVISRFGKRGFMDQFIFINPGTVSGAFKVGGAGVPQMAGAIGPGVLSYSVDGVVADNVMYAWGFNGAPSLDAAQTVEVKTNSSSAEYGSAAATVQVVTKSGTNQFHGSLYEFNRNSATAARNAFGLAAVPFLNRNEFGGSFGGPIRKDKTFFFGWLEGFKQAAGSAANATVPTPLEKNGDFSQTTWAGPTEVVVPGFPAYQHGQVIPIYDPLTQQQFPGNIIPPSRISQAAGDLTKTFYPDPNQPSHTTSPNFYFQPPTAVGELHFGGRVDQNFSDKDTLFGSFQKNDNWPDGTNFLGLPSIGFTEGDFISRSVSVNETHVFSPTLVNELRGGWNKYMVRLTDLQHNFDYGSMGITGYAAVNTAPVISISQFTGLTNFYKNDAWTSNYLILMDNLTKVWGHHTIKFGGEFRHLKATMLTGGTYIPNAQFGFDGRYSGYGFADFLLGDAASASRTLSRGQIGATQPQYHLFIQDDWKVTPKLTLNLGLRYELWMPYIELHHSVSGFDFKTGNMVISNGATVPLPAIITSNFTVETASQAGLPSNLVQTDTNNLAPRFGAAYRLMPKTVLRGAYGIFYLPVTPGYGGVTDTAYAAPFQIGQTWTANPGPFPTATLNMQDPYGGASAVPVPTVGPVAPGEVNPYLEEWNLTVEQQLSHTASFSVAYVGSHGLKMLDIRNLNQPSPGTGPIQPRRPYPAYSTIRYSDSSGNSNYNSLQLDFEKHYANGFLFRTNYTWQKTIVDFVNNYEGGPQNPFNMKAERAVSTAGQAQTLNIIYVYQLPFGPGKRFLRAGHLGQVIGGWQVSGITTFFSGPYLTPSAGFDTANVGTTSYANRICSGQLSNRTYNEYFDTSCFVMPSTGSFGNSSRNIIAGPGVEDFDVALARTFRIKERVSLEVRADAFNALNHVNPNNPNTTITSPSFGRITSAGAARVFQFGARLDF